MSVWSICSVSSCVACVGYTRWCVSAGCAPQDPWLGSLPEGGGSGAGRNAKACQEEELQSCRCAQGAVLYFASIQCFLQVLLLCGSSCQYLLLFCHSMAMKDSQPCLPDVVLCCAVLRCAALRCAAPCRAVPCRAVPCRAVPCRAVPCCAVLRCAVLRWIHPCCAVLHGALPGVQSVCLFLQS